MKISMVRKSIEDPALKVGIIGGRGQFGRWAESVCRDNGYEVVISDLGTGPSNRDLVRESTIVFVSVPIGVTATVLEEIEGVLEPHHLLVDFTSVKSHIFPILSRLRCEVLSLHPMFAPSLSTDKGQTCVVCRVRAGNQGSRVETLLERRGINLVSMGVEEHDRSMAIIQGLTHFQSIAAAHCMSRLGFVAGKSLEISSPVYRLRIAMIGRILAQDPRLYAEIQIFNPFVKDVLHTLSESSRSLENLVTAKDVDGFIAEFKVAADAFGDFTQWAKEESDRLMSLMSERSSTEVKG